MPEIFYQRARKTRLEESNEIGVEESGAIVSVSEKSGIKM